MINLPRMLRFLLAMVICACTTGVYATDRLPTLPVFKGTIGLSYLSNRPVMDFLGEHNGELVFIDATILMDVVTAYNYQILQLCSSEHHERDLDPQYIPADMSELLHGRIGGKEIPLPFFYGSSERYDDPYDALDESGLFPNDAVFCQGYSLEIQTDDNSMFHFSSAGPGMLSYSFKGFFDVFVGASGGSRYFSLVPVSEFAVELRVNSGAL